MKGAIFTIGCSNHSIETLLGLLRRHAIQAVADVRSVPFSRFTPQFNAPALKTALSRAGFYYIPMGNEFGARRTEQEAYQEGRVDFDLVRSLQSFEQGINRIREGMEKGMRIAILCTEKDPIDCHRFILVSRNLERALGVPVNHIKADCSLESTASVENRMLEKARLQQDMFNTDRDSLVEQAYRLIGTQIAYTENTEDGLHD